MSAGKENRYGGPAKIGSQNSLSRWANRHPEALEELDDVEASLTRSEIERLLDTYTTKAGVQPSHHS